MRKTDIRVLIVEDNPGDAQLVAEMLKVCVDAFFCVTHAASIEEALKMLDSSKPDVVLLDLNLPDSRGFYGVERLVNVVPEIPIIVMTGFDDETVGVKAVQKHASDYLVKGQVNSDLLVRSIKYAIERKKAETLLRENEERYRNLVEMSPEAIFINQDNKITYLNEAAVQLFGGSSPEQILGKSPFELFHPDYHPVMQERIQRLLGGCAVSLVDGKVCRLDGTVLNVEVIASPFKSQEKRAIQVLLRDITARKRAEEILKRDKDTFERLVQERTDELVDTQMKLANAKRLSDIGMLAATVAHELRNPLGVIRLAAYNIKKGDLDAAFEKHIRNIDKKIAESEQIIKNLLSYSRVKAPKFEKVIIAEILDEVLDSIRAKYQDWDVKIEIRGDKGKGGLIEADRFQMIQLFSNIIDNACQAFSSKEGTIQILEHYDEGKSLFSVIFKDNGVGMDEAALSKICEPFFTQKTKGVGLGLTVCKQITELHDGTLDFKSKKGEGTEVQVILPCQRVGEAKVS